MHVRAICFDAVGTLFDLREPVGITYARLGRRFELRADPTRLTDAFRRALRMAPPLAFPEADDASLADLERRWWRTIVDATFAAASTARVPEALSAALFDHYAGCAAWSRHQDALPVLRSLRRRGCKLAIVSNFDARLDGLAEGLGIRPLVDSIVCSGRAGAAKPDPRIFRRALGLLGALPGETLHVGDDAVMDVAGAGAAGLRAVLLDRGHGRGRTAPPGAPTIASLGELEPLLVRRRWLDG